MQKTNTKFLWYQSACINDLGTAKRLLNCYKKKLANQNCSSNHQQQKPKEAVPFSFNDNKKVSKEVSFVNGNCNWHKNACKMTGVQEQIH
jgi:hypothetical protein